jgi:hypothetical protein
VVRLRFIEDPDGVVVVIQPDASVAEQNSQKQSGIFRTQILAVEAQTSSLDRSSLDGLQANLYKDELRFFLPDTNLVSTPGSRFELSRIRSG